MFREIHVLIVEDDYDQRQLFRRIAQGMSFTVDACDTLASGLAKVDWADILIVDLRLRNGAGNTLIQRWTQSHKGPVVVVSAMVDKQEEEELLSSRAWNVLTKPFAPGVLRAVLQRYGEFVLAVRREERMEAKIKKLEIEVAKLRRLAWSLAVIAAAAGAGARPLFNILSTLFGG